MELGFRCTCRIPPPSTCQSLIPSCSLVRHTAKTPVWSSQKKRLKPSAHSFFAPFGVISARSPFSRFFLLFVLCPFCSVFWGVAYGGFAYSQFPTFNPLFTAFIRSFGGILAVANIRGGKEYGLDWHASAIRTRKQTSYSDLIGAGEWLRTQNWCGKITVHGSSNGK